jgi:hypothetical protein
MLSDSGLITEGLPLQEIKMDKEWEVVRGLNDRGASIDDPANLQALGERGGEEDVIETKVRGPGGKGESFFKGVEEAITINIAGTEQDLNRLPPNVATTQPDESAQPRRQEPRVEKFAGGKSIEVTYQDVETLLVLLDTLEQCLNLSHSPALSPVRVYGTEMQPEDSELGPRGDNLKEMMSRSWRPVPFIMGDL